MLSACIYLHKKANKPDSKGIFLIVDFLEGYLISYLLKSQCLSSLADLLHKTKEETLSFNSILQ